MQTCHSLAISLALKFLEKLIIIFSLVGGGKQRHWNENIALGAGALAYTLLSFCPAYSRVAVGGGGGIYFDLYITGLQN